MGKSTYRCTVCGYIYVGEEIIGTCPVCGATAEHFELYKTELTGEASTKREATVIDKSIKKVLIIGGGIAALSAAEKLRELSTTISITIVTNEEYLPYYRLNLTRYLAGEIGEGDLFIHDQYWYDENRIQILKNRVVVELSKEKKEVLLFDGTRLSYDKLIMAIGAHPFVPPIEGGTLEHVMSIRSIEDIKGIQPHNSGRCQILVIGGGVLGLETAVALRKKGCYVTVAEASEWLMPRQLNKQGASYVHKMLASMNIEVMYNYRTEKIEIMKQGLKVSGSKQLDQVFDYIILATGVRPNTYIARKASLEVDKGVVVDNYMRTSDPHIYAAGDVTEHYGISYGLWHIADYQGKIAAMNLLGSQVPFGGVPRSNTIKVLDIDLVSIGEIRLLDGSYRLIEQQDEDEYLGFVVHDQQLVGAIVIGHKNRISDIKDAVDNAKYMAPDVLKTTETILAVL